MRLRTRSVVDLKRNTLLWNKGQIEWRLGGNLGDKDNGSLGLANTTTAIVADESKTSDTGRADILVTASSIGNPFKCLSANCTAIIHGLYDFWSRVFFWVEFVHESDVKEGIAVCRDSHLKSLTPIQSGVPF